MPFHHYNGVYYNKFYPKMQYRFNKYFRSVNFSALLIRLSHTSPTLMDAVMEYFHITEAQLEGSTASLIQRLPKYMQEALERV